MPATAVVVLLLAVVVDGHNGHAVPIAAPANGARAGLLVGAWLLMQGRWRQLVSLLHPVGWLGFGVAAMAWLIILQ